MTGIVRTRPSLAPCSPPSRPLRAADGGGLRPVLTAAVRGVTLNLVRDEETIPSAGRTKKLRSLPDLFAACQARRTRRHVMPGKQKGLRIKVIGQQPDLFDPIA